MTELGQDVTIGVAKAEIRDAILADVLARHCVTRQQLLGASRQEDMVIARKDAARQLLQAGFSPTRISVILHRDHSTISAYFSPNHRNKLARMRTSRTVQSLPPDVREILVQYAEANQASPHRVMLDWICERARYELEARARAARAA